MDNSENIDLLAEFKKLLAVNKSQEARLDDYAKIITSRDNEIEMLQAMLSEATANRSSMDSQVKELNSLQIYLKDIQQQSGALVYLTSGSRQQRDETLNAGQQLQQLQHEYAYLQSQLTDIQSQLLDINQRNLVLQQQNSRVAELESLLLNSQEEINLAGHHPVPNA